MITAPKNKDISIRIEPNYSSWQTIELSNLFAREAIKTGVKGDVVECGVACGNNFAAMCEAGRHGVGFDSFEGIPWAGEKDDEQPGIGKKTKNTGLSSSGITVHGLEDAEKNMERWGIKDYEFVKGWFEETLPVQTATKKISVLRLDGDLYSSTLVALKHLYPLVSKGGFLIMDDWNLAGCRIAFYDYFQGKEVPSLVLDNGITYWKK